MIEHLGTIETVEVRSAGVRLTVRPDDAGGWASGLELGESIALDGCCLTLAEPVGSGRILAFDAIPETLAKTTLGGWRVGRRVHLERSMTASTLIGGHMVQGHVDGVGEVVGVERAGGQWRTSIRVDPAFLPLVPPKGSVAVDGVSLTIASVDRARSVFDIALIPTTLEKTHLDKATEGVRVNLESDIIARTVINTLTNFRHLVEGEG
ncbi:MAG: riboflavin synthase [Planctomycetota bacterium]